MKLPGNFKNAPLIVIIIAVVLAFISMLAVKLAS